ncbi:MAG: hypothetical protein DMF54_16915 [Acidobacteria bacterium]|nr:MAG: hypothetical protein DMF54_16915 [Acidobacteriota bacterium]
MQPNDSPARKSADSKAARPGSVVLLVEEEDPLRALLRRIVESEGHEVVEARSAEEALEILSGAGKSVRLVLADLAQPGIAGPQGLRKHIPRGVKLLMLSISRRSLRDLRTGSRSIFRIPSSRTRWPPSSANCSGRSDSGK